MACRDYEAGEQIFIFYGPRTNSEFFVHNGFVYPDNEHDGLRLRLGISRDDPLQPERAQLLGRLGIPASGDFMLKKGPDPVDGRLLAFLRVFNMGPGKFKIRSFASVIVIGIGIMHLTFNCNVTTL
jgi:histone-lysine N-methyltransferase SETD3